MTVSEQSWFEQLSPAQKLSLMQTDVNKLPLDLDLLPNFDLRLGYRMTGQKIESDFMWKFFCPTVELMSDYDRLISFSTKERTARLVIIQPIDVGIKQKGLVQVSLERFYQIVAFHGLKPCLEETPLEICVQKPELVDEYGELIVTRHLIPYEVRRDGLDGNVSLLKKLPDLELIQLSIAWYVDPYVHYVFERVD
jgi:hypothetical protein